MIKGALLLEFTALLLFYFLADIQDLTAKQYAIMDALKSDRKGEKI